MPEAAIQDFPWKTHKDIEGQPGNPILVRVDYNVPLTEEGTVSDDRRIEASLETIKDLISKGYRVVLMSHLGRPGGSPSPDFSLKPVHNVLEQKLSTQVHFTTELEASELERKIHSLEPGEVLLLENLRFSPGEKANDDEFSRQLASLSDTYVNDAFGTSHRSHASMTGVPEYVEESVAGQLVEEEYKVLTSIRDDPGYPFTVLLGGAKVSDKFPLIRSLLDKATQVMIGGAMAHTFFVAQGHEVGESLIEEESVGQARDILNNLDQFSGELILPVDIRAENQKNEVKVFSVDSIPEDWSAKDIGPETSEKFSRQLREANTVFWNGPLGVFEESSFENGTRSIVTELSDHPGEVVVGGGDSASAVTKFSSTEHFYHVSTGGGAALSLMNGESLPALQVLNPH